MQPNPFDLPAAPNANAPLLPVSRFPLAIAAAVVLGALVSLVLRTLAFAWNAPSTGVLAPVYDLEFFLLATLNAIFSLLLIGLASLLLAHHLFERGAVVGYRRPGRLLGLLVFASVIFASIASVAGQAPFLFFGELMMAFVRTTSSLVLQFYLSLVWSLAWILLLPLPILLCWRLFRADALIEPRARLLTRMQAAGITGLSVALLSLWVLGVGVEKFRYMGSLDNFAIFYGAGTLVALAAFAGAWKVLPARLDGLRAVSLLGASMLCVAIMSILLGFAILVIFALTYSYSSGPGLLGSLLCGSLALLLYGFCTAFCLRLVYRPVAA